MAAYSVGGSANGLQRTAQAEAGKPDSRFARYVTQRCRNVILNIQKPQNSEKYLFSAHTKCMHNYQLGSSGIGLPYSLELLNSAPSVRWLRASGERGFERTDSNIFAFMLIFECS